MVFSSPKPYLIACPSFPPRRSTHKQAISGSLKKKARKKATSSKETEGVKGRQSEHIETHRGTQREIQKSTEGRCVLADGFSLLGALKLALFVLFIRLWSRRVVPGFLPPPNPLVFAVLMTKIYRDRSRCIAPAAQMLDLRPLSMLGTLLLPCLQTILLPGTSKFAAETS